ncbi:MAG: hypothetical protein JWP82_2528 [Humibacillus sp.]|nr:hypothetical protein [Humibacillus sp.]
MTPHESHLTSDGSVFPPVTPDPPLPPGAVDIEVPDLVSAPSSPDTEATEDAPDVPDVPDETEPVADPPAQDPPD